MNHGTGHKVLVIVLVFIERSFISSLKHLEWEQIKHLKKLKVDKRV